MDGTGLRYKELTFLDRSIFNVLLHFGCKTIFLKDNDPTCHYSRLLRWHLTTCLLGEDLFTTSYVASCDASSNFQRKFFDWPAFIDHNNKELNAVLHRPMADLHMHLKGSSYNFDFSWLSVMNHVDEMRREFDEVFQKRKNEEWNSDFYDKMYRASLIRLYLASRTGLIQKELTFSQLTSMLNPLSIEEQKKLPEELRSRHPLTFREIIDAIGIKEKKGADISPFQEIDYIKIAHYNKETITSSLASERELMYKVFRLIIEGCEPHISTLFYAYLSYKSTFRQAIVQLNSTVGFRNFSIYEDLKDYFIRDNYKKFLYKAAIESFLKDNPNRYLETRIVPNENPEKIAKKLQEIYGSVDEKLTPCFNIIFHFIKKRDNREDRKYRHKFLREDIKNRAFAIYNFRNNEKNWHKNPLVGRVVGIDAANSEIYCRPEVFAQAFRFLRNHKIIHGTNQRPDDLNL